MNKLRVSVAALALSFAGFVGIATQEGYVERATVPTKNDRPTNGFGSTFNADGSPVKLGDTTTPVRALVTANIHINKLEGELRTCMAGISLFQYEYDAIVSWAYNIGAHAACNSTLMKKLKSGDYEGACRELPKWRYASGRVLKGLERRRLIEMNQCLGLIPR